MLGFSDNILMGAAIAASRTSFAKKKKVGALLFVNETQMETNAKNSIQDTRYKLFFGVNKMPDYYSLRCENVDGQTFENVIHAEEDAIMQYLKSADYNDLKKYDKTLYVTYSPCMNCCKLIYHAGIKRVVYLEEHKSNFTTSEIVGGISPKEFLLKVGISVLQLSPLENNII